MREVAKVSSNEGFYKSVDIFHTYLLLLLRKRLQNSPKSFAVFVCDRNGAYFPVSVIPFRVWFRTPMDPVKRFSDV